MNSQAKVQDEVNMHNQEKKVINASWMEVVATLALARDQGKGVARLRAYK